MEKRINWLHFSDLHYGQKSQNILLPKLKKELFKDLERLRDDIGKIDVVFFTGDLTFSGKKEEFDELTIFLKELWTVFNKVGCNPYLIAIPGNHDLLRPELRDPVVKVLRKYSDDSDTRDEFWNDFRGSEYSKLLERCFLNFTTWYKEVALPKPELNYGLIPGDISSVLTMDDLTLKVIGLNTAFLELTNGDYLGKLAVHPLQLQALTGADPLKWVDDSDIALLLTHHDMNWYDRDSLDYYNGEINPPETFFNHFCGHLHEPSLIEYGQSGSPKRRFQLAPSLFGLEKINESQSRIHGYIAGCYIVTDGEIIENIYPRTAHRQHGGGNYQIAPDHGFTLNKKYFIEIIHPKTNQLKSDSISSTQGYIDSDVKSIDHPVLDLPQEIQNILDPKKSKFDDVLEQVPHVLYAKLPQHTTIRLIEQEDFIKHLSDDHYCWLITDWSLGEDEFIGSVCDRLRIDNKNNFIVNCEDIVTDNDLFESFKDQAGISFPTFCDMINSLDRHLLVFNQLHAMMYRNTASYQKFIKIIKSITDFCPNTHVILIARQTPDEKFENNIVRLTPLDAPQIKTYIENHPNSEEYLTKPENLDKLIALTGGLPNRIDKFMTNLKYTSFQELIETENESFSSLINVETIPKSLQQTLSFFSDTTNKLKLRSFKLLKILTILSYGETHNNLKRFISTEPISLEQIAELESFSLIEISVKNRVISRVDNDTDVFQIKLFRVPQQIRYFISSMITENEQDEILKNACNLYFGPKWREGNIKNIHSSTLKSREKYLNIDNCRLIVKSLLSGAIKNGIDLEIERSALLAVNYCEHILDINDYKNAQTTSEEIYNLLKETSLDRLRAIITKVLGKALRMNGIRERSILILREALDIGESHFSNSDKNSILTNLGYAYIQLKQFDKAIDCAKIIEKTATVGGNLSLTAKYIIAQSTLEGEELLSKLRTLERNANKVDAKILANNISIQIAREFSDQQDRERRFTKVVNDGEDDYNTIRAIIAKSLDIMENGDCGINHEDLQLLNLSYSYLYGQRMASLFDDCHKALWLLCVDKGFYPELLNLFRYSSFVWRIMGKIALKKFISINL